jgi:aminomethyltransferase
MARAGWAVGWSKPTFWGKDALEKQRTEKTVRTLRGLVAQGRGIPRPGMSVLGDDGSGLGEITSGTFSPTLRQGVALALLDRAVEDGDTVVVDVRGRSEAFTVTKPPFVQPSTKTGS